MFQAGNMNLTELPEEIIIMIIRELDLQSLEYMYNTCKRLRSIVCMCGVIRQCSMSMNAMATVNTLKLNFFKDIAGHLQELSLCGVPDLNKSSLLPAIRKLKSLKTLDVSYTNVTIIDFLDMHQLCPSIRNISINFVFGKPGLVKVPLKTLLQCQSVFEHIENIQFVGSSNNLMYSKLAFYILEKAKINHLKYTIAECDYVCTTDESVECNKMPQFNEFIVYFLNWAEPNIYHGSSSDLPVLSMIELKNYEIIIINMPNINNYSVMTTSLLFKNFFRNHFNVDAEYSSEFKKALLGNVALMIWNKEFTRFDENFFHKLKNQVNTYFPYFCCSPCEIPAPNKYDWFYIIPKVPDEVLVEDVFRYEPEKRKRRVVAPNFVLDYDSTFKDKTKLGLSLLFNASITRGVTLSQNCDYLRRLTFLSLYGSVRYSPEFFNILFRSCNSLITLNVQAPPISPLASSISRSVPLTHSLKNLRLADKRIDFKTLFSSFSQCPSLENIHVLENGESELCDIGDPSLILGKCNNLYNLYIEAPMSDTARVKKLQMLNKAKARCNKYNLNVVLHAKSINNRSRYTYDPFVDVFRLNPIKPL